MPMLTLKEVAAELRVSKQWLKYWLVANPVDKDGVTFYVRRGNRLKFEARDVERILAHMRLLENTRLGMSGQRVCCLKSVTSLTKVDCESVRKRSAAKQRRRQPCG